MTTATFDRTTESAPKQGEFTRCGRHYQPNVDIVETLDELMVLAEMPGVEPNGIDVDFENGSLTISGRVAPRQGAETEYLLQEYGVGDFHRTFRVSERIDAAGINAEYRGGVLTLHLPKVEAVKARKIAVRST